MRRWLVLGVGDIATKRVLPGILAEPRSELAGIVTRDPRKAEPYGVPAWTDLEAALRECDCDTVYVATPVALHAPQTIASLRAGRDVLCEKPMARTIEEASAMVEATGDRKLGVAYYRRMYPKINRAKELIAQGAIGRVVWAEATSHDWFDPASSFRSWLYDPALAGGGPLFDVACHRIDIMNYLFGQAASVSAQLSNAVHALRVEDNATVLIEYAGGVRAMVDVRWHSRVSRDEFRIRGTDGEIAMTPLNSGLLTYPGGEEDLPPHRNLHYPCIEEFVTACESGAPFRSSGEAALETTRIIERAVSSSRFAASSVRA